jgi:hypothetical protein
MSAARVSVTRAYGATELADPHCAAPARLEAAPAMRETPNIRQAAKAFGGVRQDGPLL